MRRLIEIMGYSDGHKLPYYDKIGWVVTPPTDHPICTSFLQPNYTMPRKKAPPFLGPSPPGDTFDDFHMKQSAQAAHIKLARHRPIWTNDWTPVHTTGNRLSAKDIARFPLYVKYERTTKENWSCPTITMFS